MITVLGSGGFIGAHLVAELNWRDLEYQAPARGKPLDGRALGDLVYCVGVTEDFRRRPLDTVAAHVSHLEAVLRVARVDSLVYLSSTRLYEPGPPDLYNLSKLLGESLAEAAGMPALILRLANVYGLDLDSRNFLSSVLQDSISSGVVLLRTSLDSTRNYVAVEDVVTALLRLLEIRATGTYNVAGASNTSHGEILSHIAELTGCSVEVEPEAPTRRSPEIDIERLTREIAFEPEKVVDALPRLVKGYAQGFALTQPR